MAQNSILDFLQGASNSAASNVSAPIDGLNWLLRKAGMPVSEKPFLGSDWMAEKGLTVQPQNRNMGLLGEAIGGVLPIVAAAKAPQIAKGLLTMGDNAMAPQTMSKQAGKVFVYPQDKALATAQANAAKPISEGGLGLGPNNTPMERAKAMGFDDSFHGSKNPEGIDNLVAGGKNGAIRHGDAYGTGVYTTTDAAGDASSYGAGGAVFPLKINRTNHLQVDAPNANDLGKLSDFAGKNMLPSDKARFSVGRETRQFTDLQDARDFFGNQRENWRQFGDGMDRARPEAIANADGSFAVQFTNFDAPVPITNGKDADTLLRAVGWDNVPTMGYSGHTLDRGAGRLWDVTQDTSKIRSRFAAFDPARRHEPDLLGRADPELLAAMAGAGLLGYGGYQALKDGK